MTKDSPELLQAASVLLTLCLLTVLTGCLGLSTSSSSSQPQVGALSLSSSSLNFGSVNAGSSKALAISVTNTGTTSITISSNSISTKYFAVTSPALPVSIAAGQNVFITFSFTPNAAGTFNATSTITSDATNNPATISLSGSGVAAGSLGPNPDSLSFGSVPVGSTQSLSETVTNSSASSITISQVAASGSGFTLSGITLPLTLNAGQSTTFAVKFAPTVSGSTSGNVTITSNASNPTLTIPLSGTGATAGAITANPTSFAFGTVTVGGSQSLSGTLTNSGGSSVTISQAAVSGSGFTLSGISATLTLNAGQSTTFSVKFAPTVSGSTSGNVTITSNASNPTLTIPLSGTGAVTAGQLTVTPTNFNLGSVIVGNSASATGTLTASGANVMISGASTNNSAFSIGGLSLPTTIAAGSSTTFTLTFAPTASGTASGTLTFTSNAQPSTTTTSLTGSGTPVQTHSVSLSWNASTSSNISGYNIYRAVYASACGTFSKINSVLDTGTLYTDSNVVNGISYCYATTAVDTSNQESTYSNIVSNVQIPAQ